MNSNIVVDNYLHKIKEVREGVFEVSVQIFLEDGGHKDTGDWTDWSPVELLSLSSAEEVMGVNEGGWYLMYRFNELDKYAVFDLRDQLVRDYGKK